MIFEITKRLDLQNDLTRLEFKGGAFILLTDPPAAWKEGTRLKLEPAPLADIVLNDLKKNAPSNNSMGAVQSPWRPPELSDADVQAALDLT